MRLNSVEIQNYRSIVSTTRLDLDNSLSVLIGPNNEGKSNVLRAINLCVECLAAAQPYAVSMGAEPEAIQFRNPPSYDWFNDYPIARQARDQNGSSRLLVEFELTESEQEQYRSAVGSSTNANLPLEILIGSRTFTINVRKRRVATLTRKRAVAISKFIRERFQFQYIPAIRPSEISFSVISDLIERELGALSENEAYQQALTIVAGVQQDIYDRLGDEVQASLKLLLPSVKSVKIDVPRSDRTRRPKLFGPIIKIDDGTATGLESKGDGIKSLIAIALMRASGTSDAQGDLVVAIEEPESHLHSDAIHQLSNVLQEMSAEHQVIITTHSPLLAVRDRIRANIIVAKSTARPASSIEEIRDCLGVRIHDNLSSASCVIMVEGDCDVLALDSLFQSLSPEFKNMRRTGMIAWAPLGGAGNVGYLASVYRQSIITPVLIVDDDQAGRAAIMKGITDGRLAAANCFKLTCPGLGDSELEDHYDPNLYWPTFEASIGGRPRLPEFSIIGSKWSNKAKIVAERVGKVWSEGVEETCKTDLAKWFAADPLTRLLPTSRPLFEAVVATISAAVGKL